jgi:probable nitrogen fixation protein
MYGETTFEGLRPSEASFLRELVRLLRSQASAEAWDGKSDAELLAPLVVPPRVVHGEPDPDVFLWIELFHAAVARVIEDRTGVRCALMIRLHHEGYGRIVILAGRLVVVSRYVRDVTRFGFDGVERLAEAGEKLAESGVELIQRFPDVARLGG